MKRCLLVLSAAACAAALFASKEATMRVRFMCTPADASAAGYSVSPSDTNRLGRVVVDGYLHTQVDDGWTYQKSSAIESAPAITSTNYLWHASSERFVQPGSDDYITRE